MALGTVTGMTQAALSDTSAQQRIVSDFQTTFLLEAGAGTGKTQLLLTRLLALLRTGRSPLSRVAVITFTEKAAAELRTRLRAAVESALQTALPETERAALQAVLSELDRAMVMTIHAFCAALLRERALEVGLDPAFTVLNQTEAGLLHDQVWQTWLTQELQPGNDSAHLIRQALRAGLSVTHLKSLCDFLVEQRDCLDWLPAAVDAEVPTYCAEVHQAVTRLTASPGLLSRHHRLGIRADHDADRYRSSSLLSGQCGGLGALAVTPSDRTAPKRETGELAADHCAR